MFAVDDGKPWVLPAVKEAELQIVKNPAYDHEYLPIEGLQSFCEASAKFALGPTHPVIVEKRYAAHQAISGTGALRFAAEFYARFTAKGTKAYVSKPTWGNHVNIFNDAGIAVEEYRYWDSASRSLNLKAMLEDLSKAPSGSIIILHSCAHNPTGVDPTAEQWEQIANICEQKKHHILFDSAYQGFASGDIDRDAYSLRYFASRGLEYLLCQSYSKNFGLYNERCGCVVVVAKTPQLANNVKTQLAKIARPMISNPPAFGARIVDIILNNEALFKEWNGNLKAMANRIIDMRKRLFDSLVEKKTPGTWNHIVEQIGMFSFTGLSKAQVKVLKDKYHVYLTDNGRISMAGLNSKNIDYFADAVDFVVRNVKESNL